MSGRQRLLTPEQEAEALAWWRAKRANTFQRKAQQLGISAHGLERILERLRQEHGLAVKRNSQKSPRGEYRAHA